MPAEIPDLDLFMMCPKLNRGALIPLPHGYHVRSCRKDELPIWKAFPFDNPTEAKEYHGFMADLQFQFLDHLATRVAEINTARDWYVGGLELKPYQKEEWS